MTRPIDYSKGKIYRLNCANLVYIGSTTQTLSMRKGQHRRDCNGWLNGTTHYRSSFELFKLGNPVITLIEDYPCDRKEQLLARERFHIQNNVCVNKIIPGRTKAEHYQDNREAIIKKQIKYYDLNKEAILEKKKEYYDLNKEAIIKKTNKI